MRANKEYQLYRDIAAYLRLQYPKVMYHFDPTGLNLSKAQAGQMKAIQHSSGYPDLFIAEPRNGFAGLYIELKAEGTRTHKRNGAPATEHIANQVSALALLWDKGYRATMTVGFDMTKKVIDEYLNK